MKKYLEKYLEKQVELTSREGREYIRVILKAYDETGVVIQNGSLTLCIPWQNVADIQVV